MSKTASPTMIGVFTLIGLILAGLTLVFLGAGKFMTRTHEVLMYFEKSANGLLVGSDVRFGGVRIGKVKSISVLVDREANRKIIPVVVELAEKDLRFIGSNEGGGIDFSSFEGVAKAVRQGLRAGMKQQSLVTGQLYIEFDIIPGTPGFVYYNKSKPPHPVVPTVGTEMDELIAGISNGIQKFNSLDLESAIGDLRKALATADRQIAELNMKQISDNLVSVTGDLRAFTGNGKLEAALAKLEAAAVQIEQLSQKANTGIDPLLAEIHTGLARIDEATREISEFSNPRSPVLLRLQNVLQETERATRALKELSNDLKRDPKSILSGKAMPE
jgi:paraquat-inducible protein B